MGTTISCPCANSDDGETENGMSTNYNHNYNLYNSLRLTMQNNEILAGKNIPSFYFALIYKCYISKQKELEH